MGRFGRAWLAFAGALPLLAGYQLYRLGVELNSQIAAPRSLAVLAVHALAIALVAAIAAALAVGFRLDQRPRWVAAASFLFFAGALGTLTLVGLSAFYLTPRLAPTPVLVVAGVLLLALLGAYLRYSPAERAFVLGALRGLGLGALAVPLLSAPYIAYAAWHDEPRLTVSPPLDQTPTLRPDAPKRIVLVSFDGLRARSTSLSTPGLGTTPHMEALAEEATVYTRMKAASDRTLVSCLTMLTGLRPSDIFQDPRHDANQSGFLREGAITGLPGRLKAAGYRTAYTSMLISPEAFSLAGEFEVGNESAGLFYPTRFNVRAFLPWREAFAWWLDGAWSRPTMHETAHDEVTETRRTFDRGRRLIREGGDRSFTWVHVAAPHFPYADVPESDLGGELHPERYPLITEKQAQVAGPEEARRYEAVYERYVRFADAEFGRFLAGLQEDGTWDDTLLLVTSDHGESFQPRRMTHSIGVALEDVMAVPLIVRDPARRKPARVDTLVSHEDLAPTVLARVLQDPPAGFKGQPLDQVSPDRLVYGWAPPLDDNHARVPRTLAVWGGGHKYLEYFPERLGKVYDLASDPLETMDLADRQPGVMRKLRQAGYEATGIAP